MKLLRITKIAISCFVVLFILMMTKLRYDNYQANYDENSTTTYTDNTAQSLSDIFIDYVNNYISDKESERAAEENDNKFSATTSSDFEEVVVERVVDGDTIIVIDENGHSFRVRLIGIDTPESVNPDESKNTEAGSVASEYTKTRLLPGYTIYLQYDEEKTDVYDRTLAYVWLTDEVSTDNIDHIQTCMFNAELIIQGYAVPKVYEPNTMYADVFENIYESVR